ncbi:NUDIX domain-containing protein [Herbiconiux moechotypicola]|uniref:NUDIX domain-containing protein n=1 Tax=Herbiconiux moechotypicola TaxID=637393 RepID=A0ABN3D9B6_9MICO|nr:NUDIX domain-containing protein [Herbiconiux moechotypicola]MCS5729086.1 NUDIX domain-containing protein [Herbiconiux moechotypicola]
MSERTTPSGASAAPVVPAVAGVLLAVSTVIFALRPDADRVASGGIDADHTAPSLPSLWLPLVRRIRPPYEGQWALPGGPLQRDEDLEAAAARTLAATTALDPNYLEQLYAFGTLDRAPGDLDDRVVSIVYWALVSSDEAAQSARAEGLENVAWFSVDDLPDLAFDHDVIIEYALWRLRNKVEYSRIAHAFLGDVFTLAELREVHEAVLGRTLDPANFRRQIESSNSVVPTGKRVTGTSYRPPRLYRYNNSAEPVDRGPLARTTVPLRKPQP